MSQKKVELFSPDGKERCWFMEDEAPTGWVRSKPEFKEDEGEAPNTNEATREPQEVPEPEQEAPAQVSESTR